MQKGAASSLQYTLLTSTSSQVSNCDSVVLEIYLDRKIQSPQEGLVSKLENNSTSQVYFVKIFLNKLVKWNKIHLQPWKDT